MISSVKQLSGRQFNCLDFGGGDWDQQGKMLERFGSSKQEV